MVGRLKICDRLPRFLIMPGQVELFTRLGEHLQYRTENCLLDGA